MGINANSAGGVRNGRNANVSGSKNGGNGYNGGHGKSVGSYRNGGNGITKATVDGNRARNASADAVSNGRGNKPPNGMNNSGGSGASGSRFEVLNEEVEEFINENTLISDSKHHEGNIPSVKIALAEITNANKKQSIKTGKGIKKVTKKIEKLGIKKTGNQSAASVLRENSSMNELSQEQYLSGLGKGIEVHLNENMNGLEPLHKEGREFESNCEEVVEGVSTLGIQKNIGMPIDKFDALALNLEVAMAAISE